MTEAQTLRAGQAALGAVCEGGELAAAVIVIVGRTAVVSLFTAYVGGAAVEVASVVGAIEDAGESEA